MRGDLVELWHEVFSDPYDWIEKFDAERKPETYEHKISGRAVSALHLFDIRYSIKGEMHEAKYLVGAATYAQYRKNGYMSALIKEAIKDHSEGIFLFPAVRPFYQKLGFHSPRVGFAIGKSEKRIPCPDNPDNKRINSIYLSCFEQSGCIIKDERAWKEKLEENSLLLLSDSYALFSKTSKNLTECAYSSKVGFAELQDHIGSFLPPEDANKDGWTISNGMTTLNVPDGFYIPEIY